MQKATNLENKKITRRRNRNAKYSNRVMVAQTYSCSIGFIGVIFFGNKKEQNSIPKLNPTEGCDSHVEEDSEQSRNRNHF